MTAIDIALPKELQEALAKPVCAELKLPKPSIPQITMPNGAIIKPIADFTKGIPDDCSMSFSLVAQLAPVMLSIECLMRVLALVQPLSEIVTGLTATPPDVPKAAKAVPDFAKAVEELAGCLLLIYPPNILKFLRDVIALLAKLLRCLIQQLQSVLDLLTDLALRIDIANANGDSGLVESLECAMENADTTTDGLMASVESIAAVLALITPFLELAGKSVELPSMDTGVDTGNLQDTLDTLEAVAVGLEEFAESLGAE